LRRMGNSASRITSEAARLGWRNLVAYGFIGGPRYVGTNLAQPDGTAARGVTIVPEIDVPGSRVESLRIRHAGLGQTFHDAFERLWRRGVPFGRALEGDGGPAPDGATIKPRGTGELRSRGQGGRSAEDD